MPPKPPHQNHGGTEPKKKKPFSDESSSDESSSEESGSDSGSDESKLCESAEESVDGASDDEEDRGKQR